MSTKPTNPKDIIGSDKLPLHLWPSTATALGCLGLLDGALKYGRSNFRACGVKASIYYDALNRHVNAWFEGEELDQDSKLPHLAHALACLAILVEAQAKGNLTDDRMFPTAYRDWVDKLTPNVERLKVLRRQAAPTHYTIDAVSPDEFTNAFPEESHSAVLKKATKASANPKTWPFTNREDGLL